MVRRSLKIFINSTFKEIPDLNKSAEKSRGLLDNGISGPVTTARAAHIYLKEVLKSIF